MKYDIWTEGFQTSGEIGTAQCMITGIEADSFRDAVIAVSKLPEAKNWGNFNADTLSFWGCRCFETEAEARSSFG